VGPHLREAEAQAVREIPLGRGKVALVDDEDFDHLNAFRWNAGGGYARRLDWNGVGQKLNAILMHRVVMDARPGQEVDHINGNGLDNRKANLRLCSHLQNSRNRKKQVLTQGRRSSSAYKGVYRRSSGKWAASIRIDQRQVYLGTFATEVDAAVAYAKAAREHHGDFARVA
jgi:hypothetical protein